MAHGIALKFSTTLTYLDIESSHCREVNPFMILGTCSKLTHLRYVTGVHHLPDTFHARIVAPNFAAWFADVIYLSVDEINDIAALSTCTRLESLFFKVSKDSPNVVESVEVTFKLPNIKIIHIDKVLHCNKQNGEWRIFAPPKGRGDDRLRMISIMEGSSVRKLLLDSLLYDPSMVDFYPRKPIYNHLSNNSWDFAVERKHLLQSITARPSNFDFYAHLKEFLEKQCETLTEVQLTYEYGTDNANSEHKFLYELVFNQFMLHCPQFDTVL